MSKPIGILTLKLLDYRLRWRGSRLCDLYLFFFLKSGKAVIGIVYRALRFGITTWEHRYCFVSPSVMKTCQQLCSWDRISCAVSDPKALYPVVHGKQQNVWRTTQKALVWLAARFRLALPLTDLNWQHPPGPWPPQWRVNDGHRAISNWLIVLAP